MTVEERGGKMVVELEYPLPIRIPAGGDLLCAEGHELTGTMDLVDAKAMFDECDDGAMEETHRARSGAHLPEYSGETEVDWDSQETVEFDGLPVMLCAYGHAAVRAHEDVE